MLIVLSPAKKQDFDPVAPEIKSTQPQTKKDTSELITTLKTLSTAEIKKLMSVSDNIAKLNWQRFKAFNPDNYALSNAKQAVFAFQGDAYKSLDTDSLSLADLTYAQQHLMILSGLYGYLRPLDLIQPYRLEMKTKLPNERGNDLYQFWGNKISQGLNKALKKIGAKTIINLASSEYFAAINQDTINGSIINIHFKELKQGNYKVIGIHAKRARGAMTRYIIQNKVSTMAALKKFNLLNYQYNAELSNTHNLVFTRS